LNTESSSNSQNLITVVIPARDRHEGLDRAVCAVRAQTAINVALVIVDDGSVHPIAKPELGGSVTDVRLLRNKQPRNAAVARNQAASLCNTDLIAFLDSDDQWPEDHLATAIDALNRNTGVSFYVGSYRTNISIPDNSLVSISDPYAFQFESSGSLRTSCFVFKADFFRAIGGFDEDLAKHQDWDLGLRAGRCAPFLWNKNKTVLIDSEAEGRMSYRPNPEASRRFLSRHGPEMNSLQILQFLSGLVKGSSGRQLSGERKAIKALVREWCSPIKLPWQTMFFWIFPNLSFKLRSVMRRMR
jgi:glycosyltransferase involved in cell wall biosynthesis